MGRYDFFQAGGALHAEAACYIERQCDEDVFRAIRAYRYVSVLGPRQIGKTSILYKTQTRLERAATPCAYIDMSNLVGADIARVQSTAEEQAVAASWYNALATELHYQFPHKPINKPYRDKTVRDSRSFIAFLNSQEVVANPNDRAVIMFDEAAAVPPMLKSAFFMSLRTLYNERAQRSQKPHSATRFDFVFAGAFYPASLVTDPRLSPFNVSCEVYVPDFNHREIMTLLQRSTQQPDHVDMDDAAKNEIWSLAQGHPFLTQKICLNAVSRSQQRICLNDVKDIVDEILYRDAHLHNLELRLNENPREVELIRRVVERREKVPWNPIAAQLEMVGALKKGSDGYTHPRNEIYNRFFRTYLGNLANQIQG